jgi:hypothetical protein
MEKNGLLVDYTSCELSASQGSEPVAVSSAQSAVRKFEEGLAALEAVGNPQRYEAVHTVLSTEITTNRTSHQFSNSFPPSLHEYERPQPVTMKFFSPFAFILKILYIFAS